MTKYKREVFLLKKKDYYCFSKVYVQVYVLCFHLVAILIIATVPVSRTQWNFPPLDRNYEFWLCPPGKQKSNNRLGRLKSLKGVTLSLL